MRLPLPSNHCHMEEVNTDGVQYKQIGFAYERANSGAIDRPPAVAPLRRSASFEARWCGPAANMMLGMLWFAS